MLFERQEYQENCVNNIINVLKDYDFYTHDFQNLQYSLNDFYKTDSNIPVKECSQKLKLDIEMETGTGKTFTYLKTIFELNKNYNQNKFIIFVPRKAIREGVVQNINLTSDYFFSEYGKRLVKYIYDSKMSIINIKNHYIRNKDELSVLILTNSSIDKKGTNNIHKYQEDLFGGNSIFDEIKDIKPIIFIDEPHLLKGEEFSKIFNEFDSLYFRFGATFPKEDEHKISNMIYSLDSVSSFKNYLVKKIRVNTIITHEAIIKINAMNSKSVELLYFQDNEEKKVTITTSDDIGIKTGLENFNGVNIVNISMKEKKVYLSNQTELHYESSYQISESEMRLMIAKTIELHFEKEQQFFNSGDNGVKVLSLFFIPNVADFRGDNPIVKTIFEDEYIKQRNEILANKNINKNYKAFLLKDYNDDNKLRVHEGYFSGDRGSVDDKVASGIDIILKDKEKLLSIDTPLRFIFSVWALQEGWDNPNVFNICKLANTDKDTSRRQQIGRGLRICVNQAGKRLTYNYLNENENQFYEYNTLDVIVSGKEKNFIEEIQNEILENSYSLYLNKTLSANFFLEVGLDASQNDRLKILLEDNEVIKVDGLKYEIKSDILEFIKDNKKDVLKCKLDDTLYQHVCNKLEGLGKNKTSFIDNGNKQTNQIKIRQNKLKEFTELWQTINKKSKIVYSSIKEDFIIDNIVATFAKENIDPISIRYESKSYDAKNNTIVNEKIESGEKIEFLKGHRYMEYMFEFSKDECLPLGFTAKLFDKIKKESFMNNPREAKVRLKAIIKNAIHAGIIQSVEYQFEGTKKITSLQNNDGSYKQEIKSSLLGRFISDKPSPDNFLYESIAYDSKIEETIILNDPKKVDNYSITVFAKLPQISIPTPYKNYNPDFAYLMQTDKGKTLFLIVEAKGYNADSDIPEDEAKKIEYAEMFFESLQKELNDVEIVFKKRINRTDLVDLLNNIRG